MSEQQVPQGFVWLVLPPDTSDEPNVFLNEEDAQAFAETYANGAENAWVTEQPVLTSEDAAQMAADRRAMGDWRQDRNEARIAATCSRCGARTYRGEECVCEDGGDAEAYDEVMDDLSTDPRGSYAEHMKQAHARLTPPFRQES